MVRFDRRFSRAIITTFFVQVLAMVSVALPAGRAVAGEIEPEYWLPAPEPGFHMASGVALTNDYVSRGITNSNGEPAIQGYVEPSIAISGLGAAYVGVWSSHVDYGEGFEGAEIDVSGGIRPRFGSLALDLGYLHYFYAPEHVSPDYGEFFAKADYNFEDMFSVGGRLFFAPDYNQSGNSGTFVAGGVRVPLQDFSLYGGLGYQFFEDPNEFEQLAWTAGISYYWKALTIDVRYWSTDLSDDQCVVRSGFSDGCGSRIVATLVFETTLSDFRDWVSGK
ncbi:MAG TPA: TorF family putative porin [Pseudaminobacter sp.]|nr:TorF family putative porin [Pseudaminobacter sp.]